jgi:hypothetical protein
MKDVFAKLATDFLSTIVFLALYLATDNVVLAFYVSVILIGAKLIAFAVQYLAFRILVTNRIRAARA